MTFHFSKLAAIPEDVGAKRGGDAIGAARGLPATLIPLHAGGGGKPAEGRLDVIDDEQRGVTGNRLGTALDHGRRGALGQGFVDEVVTVEIGPGEGDEQIASADLAAVRGNAVALPCHGDMAAGRGLRLG